MTLINRLTKEARGSPECLTINLGQVREMAAHFHSLMIRADNLSIEEIEEMIKAGEVRFCEIPVRVIGHQS